MYLQSVYRVFFTYDIIIYFQSGREQTEYLVILLQTLRREQFHATRSKYEFWTGKYLILGSCLFEGSNIRQF